jgi:hypothetical protein
MMGFSESKIERKEELNGENSESEEEQENYNSIKSMT